MSLVEDSDLFTPLDASFRKNLSSEFNSVSPSFWHEKWLVFKNNRFALIGIGILISLLIFSLIGPYISGHVYDETHLSLKNHPPDTFLVWNR